MQSCIPLCNAVVLKNRVYKSCVPLLYTVAKWLRLECGILGVMVGGIAGRAPSVAGLIKMNSVSVNRLFLSTLQPSSNRMHCAAYHWSSVLKKSHWY